MTRIEFKGHSEKEILTIKRYLEKKYNRFNLTKSDAARWAISEMVETIKERERDGNQTH